MAPQAKYLNYSAKNKSIEQLTFDKKRFQQEVENISEFLENEVQAEGGSFSFTSGDEDRTALIENITAIEEELQRIRNIVTPEQKLSKIEFGLERNRISREKLKDQEKETYNDKSISDDDRALRLAEIYSNYSSLISSDKKLKEGRHQVRNEMVQKSLTEVDEELDQGSMMLDRSDEEELKRAERLSIATLKLKELQNIGWSSDSGNEISDDNSDEIFGDEQCRMNKKGKNTNKLRCQKRFTTRQNRNRHEDRVHPGEAFWHEP